MSNLRVLVIMGTRPEVIKLAPVIKELRVRDAVTSFVCVTAQHREMLDQVLRWFRILPDVDLDLMEPGQGLARFAGRALAGLSKVVSSLKPDVVLVQGDTTTAFAAALAAFYERVAVGHVEAGLRTGSRYEPFPEELNRRLISELATYHFAPTPHAARVLEREGFQKEAIFTTGNTVVDALKHTLGQAVPLPDVMNSLEGRKLVLVTAHRRESFGHPLESFYLGLRDLAQHFSDIEIIYPVHPNPNVRETALRILEKCPRIRLLDPVPYEQFVHLLDRACLVLTDSGGVQEEAAVLCKPTLVLRDVTDRPEAIEAGIGKLVGTDRTSVFRESAKALKEGPSGTFVGENPFGDGKSSKRIVDILLSHHVHKDEH